VPVKPNMTQMSKDIRKIVNTNAEGKLDSTVGLRYAQYLEK